ncbi:MAG: hypothetical protein ACUVUF_08625, partial [Candidatus Bathycorpusculaceae bacterium]
MEKAKEGLSDEDLGFALVDVVLVGKPVESRSLDALVFNVEFQGEQYRIGVIGNEALESVKKHGYKDNEGKIHLKVPQSKLKEPIGWINEA